MIEQKEGTFLGKKTDYKFHYDKSLILPVPRSEERSKIGIKQDLPFKGFDVWNAYEFSTLTNNGIPVVGILKLVYPCDSKSLVESKSLKLYLNGYSMTKTGDCEASCLYFCQRQIAVDLSEALETNVQAVIFAEQDWEIPKFQPEYHYSALSDFTAGAECSVYKEDPSLLKITKETKETKVDVEHRFYSPLVRSCCKITHQPDFGTYYIKYYGKKHIDRESLLKYLVSFRDEWHFHEECTELVFKRLSDLLEPDQLCVACFYTRRGGIDINVIRATSMFYANSDWVNYLDVKQISFKLPRQ